MLFGITGVKNDRKWMKELDPGTKRPASRSQCRPLTVRSKGGNRQVHHLLWTGNTGT